MGEWSGLLLYDASETVGETDYKANLIDGGSNFARQYDVETGAREVLDFADIYLGAGRWTGCVATSDRKIFLDNAGNRAVFYDMENELQASEEIDLGEGDWQDVCCVAVNRLVFLDRATGALRVYDVTTRSRVSSEDVVFGFDAKFRSIAPNANFTKLFVLIENLGALLVWSGSGFDDAIELIGGTSDWQSVILHPAGHLLGLQKNATRAIAIQTNGTRNKTLDLVLK